MRPSVLRASLEIACGLRGSGCPGAGDVAGPRGQPRLTLTYFRSQSTLNSLLPSPPPLPCEIYFKRSEFSLHLPLKCAARDKWVVNRLRGGEARWAKPGGCACWGGAAGVLISQSPCVHWSLHSFPGRGWQGSGILGVPAPTPISASGSSRSFSGGWDSPLASRQIPAPVCPCPSRGPLPASPQSPAE